MLEVCDEIGIVVGTKQFFFSFFFSTNQACIRSSRPFYEYISLFASRCSADGNGEKDGQRRTKGVAGEIVRPGVAVLSPADNSSAQFLKARHFVSCDIFSLGKICGFNCRGLFLDALRPSWAGNSLRHKGYYTLFKRYNAYGCTRQRA